MLHIGRWPQERSFLPAGLKNPARQETILETLYLEFLRCWDGKNPISVDASGLRDRRKLHRAVRVVNQLNPLPVVAGIFLWKKKQRETQSPAGRMLSTTPPLPVWHEWGFRDCFFWGRSFLWLLRRHRPRAGPILTPQSVDVWWSSRPPLWFQWGAECKAVRQKKSFFYQILKQILESSNPGDAEDPIGLRCQQPALPDPRALRRTCRIDDLQKSLPTSTILWS